MTQHILAVDISDGTSLAFDSINEINSWYSEERSFWNWFQNAPMSNMGGSLPNFRAEFFNALNSIGVRIQELQKNPESQNSLQALRNAIQVPVNNSKLILRQHPFAVIAKEVSEKSGPTAGAVALGWLLKIPMENSAQVEGILQATFLRDNLTASSPRLLEKALSEVWLNNKPKIDNVLGEVAKRADEFSVLIQKSQNEWQSVLSARERSWKEIEERINNEMNAAIRSIQNTEAIYKKQMELQASVDYWTAKADKHAATADSLKRSLLRFSCFGGPGLLLGLVVLSVLAGSVAGGDVAIYLKFVAVGAVAVTLVFWIARILLRLFLSERHLATDAEERVTMVKTYLALANETKIEPADRALVLGPLFRSAADGIVKDDGPDSSLAGIIARAVDIKSRS